MDASALATVIEQLTNEGLIDMKEAAQLYGRGTHKSTPTRHAIKGIVGPNGRVFLECVRVGHSLRTSKQAVLRFFAAQSAPAAAPAARPTPAATSRAAQRAHEDLAAVLGS